MRRIVIPLIFGLAGAAVLISLGIWQVQRLTWKAGVLAEIEAKIAAAPVALPAKPDPVRDKYLPVIAAGVLSGPELHVLVSRKNIGAGYRVIQPFDMQGHRILVDRGFVRLEEKDTPRAQVHVTLTGNLHWPDEVDSYTPEPDRDRNIWFARDVPAMARALKTEPVLLVVRNSSQSDPSVTPLPVDTGAIPNDHLEYAITWFSLAAIWITMTGYFIWRQRRKQEGRQA